MAATGTIAYRIVVKAEVEAIDAAGHYVGSALDERDGYLHMSTAETVRDTAQKYYAGRDDVVLLTIGELAAVMRAGGGGKASGRHDLALAAC